MLQPSGITRGGAAAGAGAAPRAAGATAGAGTWRVFGSFESCIGIAADDAPASLHWRLRPASRTPAASARGAAGP
jgi:hypothetical protein